MSWNWYHRSGKTAILAGILALILIPAPSVLGAKPGDVPTNVERNGRLPASGKIVLRSGLAGMNETSPLFRSLEQSLIPLLTEKGLTVVPCQPSALGQSPRDSASVRQEPPSSNQPRTAQGPSSGAGYGAASEDEAKARAEKMGAEGKLPKLKLNAYTAPVNDTDLPDSITNIRSPDRTSVLFFLSQEQGMPLLNRGGPLPGRLPSEVTRTDPKNADYALVCRFALVSATSRSSLERGTLLAAAGTVGGVSGMGYGRGGGSAPAKAPVYGGGKGDYARGYEGLSPIPGAPWGRQHDMKARNYMQRYGPEGEFAAPPQGAASTGTPGGRFAPVTGREIRSFPGGPGASAGVTGYALELECYSLARARQGKKPELIWKAVVHQQAHGIGLEAALPGLAAEALKN